MDDRYDDLTPPYVIASLRSMPRRFASALAVDASSIHADVLAQVSDGTSAAAEIGAMVAQLAVLDDAIHKTVLGSSDSLGAEVDAAIANAGAGSRLDPGADGVAVVELHTSTLADRLDGLNLDDWTRTASTPGGSPSVTDMARGAVRVAAERLRAAERIVRTAHPD